MVRSLTKRGMPKPFAILIAALMALYFVPLGALPASADVVIEEGGSGCNGVLTTPGSENTLKDIVGGDFQPGGEVTFEISYPAEAAEEGGDFVITDCFMFRIGGTPGEDYGANDLETLPGSPFTLTGVPNNEDFTFTYTLQIPDTLPLGTEVCNFAKTTADPTDPQASNRKGSVCFTVGGTLRIEKQDAATGDPLEGAKFTVDCDPTADFPLVVIFGLEDARPYGDPVTGNPVTGYANDGFIAISAPEGTECTVTELEAPPGYVLPDDTTFTYIVPRAGTSVDPEVILNSAPEPTSIVTQATGTVTIGSSIQDSATVTPADAEGTVTFRLYGPGDTTCSGPAIFTSADRPLDASGVATSASFTPTAVGTYRWIANFGLARLARFPELNRCLQRSQRDVGGDADHAGDQHRRSRQ